MPSDALLSPVLKYFSLTSAQCGLQQRQKRILKSHEGAKSDKMKKLWRANSLFVQTCCEEIFKSTR